MKLLLGALLLVSNVVFAGGISAITSDQCRPSAIPNVSPFVPRPIAGTVSVGKAAKAKISQLKSSAGAEKTVTADLFLQKVETLNKRIFTATEFTGNYPADGCEYTATLFDTCVSDTSGSAKCGQLCVYKYKCIDNR